MNSPISPSALPTTEEARIVRLPTSPPDPRSDRSAATAGDPCPPPGATAGGFPAIADYALLSDCENTCLVSSAGAVEWLCLPRPQDPSVFGALLDRSAGSFAFGPADVTVPVSRRYLPGTKVLETTWQTRTGWLTIQDFLVVAPWHRTQDRSALHRRTPGDFDSEHTLLRIATCVHGSVDVALDCRPAGDYGRTGVAWDYAGDGYGEVVTTSSGHPSLRLAGDLRLGIEGRAVRARHHMQTGESCFVALSWGTLPPPRSLGGAHESLAHTAHFWRTWLAAAKLPDHPLREPLQRSALTLKALSYAPTGAFLAAPTTSLPEELGGERNWDYRYTWIRDASFTLRALHGLELDTEADDFLAFLAETLSPEGDSDAPAFQVLYGVDGSREIPETHLDHLSGYERARPVRTGNAAYLQEQHDVYGAVVDCVYLHTRNQDALSERSWQLVKVAVEEALRRWPEPDRGIWEVRGEPRHFTQSKVMCWVAADRGARLAAMHGDRERAERWSAAANEIHRDVLAHAVDAKGRLTQSYGSDNLDASVLTLVFLKFLPVDDPRLRATVLGIADELTEGDFVVRYRPEVADDGLNGGEGAFLACSFWLASALAKIGETERARALFERLLATASPMGLYAEEFDARTGLHLGNYPQALTHLALINAVLHLIAAENEPAVGPREARRFR